jgi:colanic acid/amylovoran biosynthesis glycosyltransferase
MLSATIDGQVTAEAVRNPQPRPVVAIFAEPLLAPSMTFVRAQASALTRFAPLYVSPQRAFPSLEIPPNQEVVLCDDPKAPWVWNRLKQVPFKVFGYSPRFFRRVGEHKPVLVHAHCGPAGLTALPLARWLKVPIVVAIHGFDATVTDAHLARSHYRARAYVRNRHVLHQQAALYIAVSEFLRKEMLNRGFPEERIVVHYTGVDRRFFQPDPHTAREPVVLFTGRLTEKKGCAHLIRAMQEVQAVVPTARLVVIGDGELRQELEHMTSKKLRNYSFLGVQSPAVVRDWMNRARVFCVPSIRAQSGDAEGFGMVFVEAQAMGLPVASFASGGIPEAVAHGETGLLAEELDWRTLARNILLLLSNDTLWTNMSLAGRQRIHRLFDLASQTKILEDLYVQILEQVAAAGS